MSTYTIRVYNQSAEWKEFLLFNAPPKVSQTPDKAYSNVWIKSKMTPNPNGMVQFSITTDHFAVCGTTTVKLKDGVEVETSHFYDVSKTVVLDLFPPPSDTTHANSFGIKVGGYNPEEYRNIWCGYGKHDAGNNVVPVAVWSAEPSTTYLITPIVRYYIGTGSHKQGTTVNVTELGQYATIDFTKVQKGQTVAEVTLKNDGTYTTPTFKYPSKLP
ncbi:hypothetical protein BDZ91DRAFT_797610 [Kalaharituber pfeilii]|nr:hypothetical protein BDZ91DRAFT_797610 [Kalaharituber pfeilii]